MKKIQIARLTTQILFLALTITAVLMEFSTIKIVIVLTTVLGGVFYCGWACPFGFIQDIGSRIGKNLALVVDKYLVKFIKLFYIYAIYWQLLQLLLLQTILCV